MQPFIFKIGEPNAKFKALIIGKNIANQNILVPCPQIGNTMMFMVYCVYQCPKNGNMMDANLYILDWGVNVKGKALLIGKLPNQKLQTKTHCTIMDAAIYF